MIEITKREAILVISAIRSLQIPGTLVEDYADIIHKMMNLFEPGEIERNIGRNLDEWLPRNAKSAGANGAGAPAARG